MTNKTPVEKYVALIKVYESAFLKVIHDRLGIVIRVHQTTELFRTIAEGCEKFDLAPSEYLQAIKQNPPHSAILEHLIAGVTVGETYFFRDKRQMSLLENTLLPRLINKKQEQGQRTLRIWSAACSTGEEIYTVAMILKEKLMLKEWSINLLATDINKKAIEKAVQGTYSQWSMRAIPDYYKEKYFVHEYKRFILSEDIKKMAKFNYLNLHDPTYPAILNDTNAYDIIFCRNVMIYFDNEVVSAIMKRLSACLVEGGYLILGASDPVDITDSGLNFCNEEGAIYFQKDKMHD